MTAAGPVRSGDRLLPPHHHGLLGGEALLQHPEGEVRRGRFVLADLPGRGRLEQIEGLLEGVGRLGRADMTQQLGRIAERRGEAGAVGGIVNAQLLGQLGQYRLNLNPELGPAALDSQRQGMVDVIGHADNVPGRSAGPVPAAHLGDAPAKPECGQHLSSVIHHVRLLRKRDHIESSPFGEFLSLRRPEMKKGEMNGYAAGLRAGLRARRGRRLR
jgi:hypothetical protein